MSRKLARRLAEMLVSGDVASVRAEPEALGRDVIEVLDEEHGIKAEIEKGRVRLQGGGS